MNLCSVRVYVCFSFDDMYVFGKVNVCVQWAAKQGLQLAANKAKQTKQKSMYVFNGLQRKGFNWLQSKQSKVHSTQMTTVVKFISTNNMLD